MLWPDFRLCSSCGCALVLLCCSHPPPTENLTYSSADSLTHTLCLSVSLPMSLSVCPPVCLFVSLSRFEDIGHSDEAMSDMKKYLIGTVENYDPEKYKAAASGGGGGGGGMMNIILILLLLAAAGFAYTQLGGEGSSEL